MSPLVSFFMRDSMIQIDLNGRLRFPKQGISALLFMLALLFCGCRHSGQSVVTSPSPDANVTGAPAYSSKTSEDAARSGIGFASRRKFLDHYEKHGHEFGSISKDEYLRQAQQLRDCQAGADVLEVIREDGVVTRFDKKSGAFLAFNPDLTIRTFFKPNDGEAYFRRQGKRPAFQSGRNSND